MVPDYTWYINSVYFEIATEYNMFKMTELHKKS